MLCYKDRSFCLWATEKCPRYLSEDDKERAKELGLSISYIECNDCPYQMDELKTMLYERDNG